MTETSQAMSRRDLLALGVGAVSLKPFDQQPFTAEEQKQGALPLLLLGEGATVSVDAAHLTPRLLVVLAGTGAEKGARLIVRNAAATDPRALLAIAGPRVIFEL